MTNSQNSFIVGCAMAALMTVMPAVTPASARSRADDRADVRVADHADGRADKPAAPAAAPPASPAGAAPAPASRPPLLVVISIDQFSSTLFGQYRQDFTGGLKQLASGTVFATAYQAQAATETCPGHSTLLTGTWPWRSGIIANNWFDPKAARGDKRLYCAEDETVAGTNSESYTVSPVHLRVPTLGDRMATAQTGGLNVAVAGKDRAAVMMGGHAPDQIWWWGGRGYVSYKGKAAPASVTAINERLDTALEQPVAPAPMVARCAALVKPIVLSPEKTVGIERGPTDAGDVKAFRTTTLFDQSTLDLAIGLVDELKLGHHGATDVLSISLSATDYIGHTYGPQGPEMCTHLMALDGALGGFLAKLDALVPGRVIVVTADHGGLDIPERVADGKAARVKPELLPGALDEAVGKALGIDAFTLIADGPAGDIYFTDAVTEAMRPRAIEALRANAMKSGQVEAVFSRQDILDTPRPTTTPDQWTVRERVAANWDKERSGDAYIVLKPEITPIADTSGYIATHGSVWDYDRQVPILFSGPGVPVADRRDPVATVDIMPTLAAMMGLAVDPATIDGKCIGGLGAAAVCR